MNVMRRHCLVTLLIVAAGVGLCVNQGAQAANAPGKAAIASAHPLATQAGETILKAGGNAFDAAVAVTAALAVVEPQSSGLGGGGFYLLHRARDGRDVFVDARETAPAAANRDMYLDKEGNVIPGASIIGARAAGIPGEVAAMAHLATHYGKLPLAKSLAPAIALARDGFPLYPRLRASIEFSTKWLRQSPAVAHIFLDNDAAPTLGFVIKQPDLANTLALIAHDGAQGFYTGKLAQQLVNGVQQQNGIWTLDDLRGYRVMERAPMRFTYEGNTIISAPPPSSGGVGLAEIFNVLSGYSFSTLGVTDQQHLVIEALRRAARDRAQYLGDPDFVKVPVAMLTSKDYAAGLATSIRLDHATPSSLLAPIGSPAQESTQTTHFSIMDKEGNRVAATITVNLGFGSGVMIDGTGFFLNNEMDDFVAKPGVPNTFHLVGTEANTIAPGKRMLSSMTPTFVENDHGVLILGTPGGSRITSMVLLGILDWLDGHDAAHIAARPRFHHQYMPDVVSFEPGALSADEQRALQQRGHVLNELHSPYGNLQVITWDKTTNTVQAASDPRGEGEGWIY